MGKDGIDASIGLTFSLELFKRYRRNGVLQGDIPRMPGIQGRCTAFLHLVNGEVISVYVEDNQGQRYSSDKDTLCRLDKEKGPFEWTLLPQPAAPHQSQPTEPFQPPGQLPFPNPAARSMPRSPVPRIVSVLMWDRLSTWTPQQKDAVYTVMTTINGERTIEDIKGIVPLPPTLVDEIVRILLELKVIVISA